MLRYIARRLLLVPVVLLGMTLLTFTLSQIVPTDPVAAFLGARYDPGTNADAAIAQIKAKWGWDKPIYERCVIHGRNNVLHGDLGTSSTSRRPVIDDLVRELTRRPRPIEPGHHSRVAGASSSAIPLGVSTVAAGRPHRCFVQDLLGLRRLEPRVLAGHP